MLMILAGMASAAEYVLTLDAQTATGNFDTTATAGYITAVLDLDTFKTLVTTQTSDCLMTFTLNGVTDKSGNPIVNVGAGTQDNTIKGTHNAVGSTVTAFYTPKPDSLSDLSTKLDFDDIASVGLTFAYNKTDGSKIILTTLANDGTYTDYVSPVSGLKWSSSNISGANIDAHYIDFAKVYTGTYTEEELINTAHSLVTPEPATATLSLLALAGLAARRRRH